MEIITIYIIVKTGFLFIASAFLISAFVVGFKAVKNAQYELGEIAYWLETIRDQILYK